MMKTSKISALRSALVAALMFGASGAIAADTVTVDAAAEVVGAIALNHTGKLDFGQVVGGASTTGGTVVMSAAGSRSPNGVVLGSDPGEVPVFVVTGDADSTYAIALPEGSIPMTGAGEGMSIGSFTTSHTSSALTGTLTGGTDSFSVGATLTVGANQAPGLYSATFPVTVAYN